VTATAQSGEARGVNPADNISKIELLPKVSVVDDAAGVSVTTFTLKYDRAIRGIYGINLELPLTRFESPSRSRNGVADLNVRGRAQFRMGRWTGIVGVEGVIPVATDDTLGSGKFQVNPTAVAVYPFSRSVFLALIAKQFVSVAGDDERADLRQGLYRALVAYSSPKGWWVLGDPQLYVDYDSAGRKDFQLEAEAGKMVGPMTGVWLRGGGHVGGNWTRNEWAISAGVRFIKL
jgi:hypothetical protein